LKLGYISIIQDVKTNIPEIGCKGKIYLAVKGRLLLIFSQRTLWMWDGGCRMWDVGCGMADVGCGMRIINTSTYQPINQFRMADGGWRMLHVACGESEICNPKSEILSPSHKTFFPNYRLPKHFL
jgi:hypothetical protein